MILYSQQIQIIKSYFVSFKNQKKSFTRITDQELKRYKKVLRWQKFEDWTDTDFKLLVLLSLLHSRFGSLQALLKYLSDTPKEELRKVLNEKDDLVAYQTSLDFDLEIIENRKPTADEVIRLYRTGKISVIGFYFFYLKNEDQFTGRIKNKAKDDLCTFFQFFPAVQEYVKTRLNLK